MGRKLQIGQMLKLPLEICWLLMNRKLIVELLDGALGHSIQKWEINGEHSVQIGRSAESDVVIRNPYVSRCHACIVREGERWILNGISSQGMLQDGEVVQAVEIQDETVIRLSRRGPFLRVAIHNDISDLRVDDLSGMATISNDDVAIPMLFLDREQRDQEVAEIEKEDYFSNLKEMAHQLRKQKAKDV